MSDAGKNAEKKVEIPAKKDIKTAEEEEDEAFHCLEAAKATYMLKQIDEEARRAAKSRSKDVSGGSLGLEKKKWSACWRLLRLQHPKWSYVIHEIDNKRMIKFFKFGSWRGFNCCEVSCWWIDVITYQFEEILCVSRKNSHQYVVGHTIALISCSRHTNTKTFLRSQSILSSSK